VHDVHTSLTSYTSCAPISGVAVRSAIDVLIASFCIEHGYSLLHDDRDYDAFVELRGMRAWRH